MLEKTFMMLGILRKHLMKIKIVRILLRKHFKTLLNTLLKHFPFGKHYPNKFFGMVLMHE